MLKFSLATFISVVLGATRALSLAVDMPNSANADAPLTLEWNITPPDPTFSILLFEESSTFRLVLFEDLDPSQNQITVHIPGVQTQDAYILEFVSVNNVNEVFVTSAHFEILPVA
ncbi:hypothetical protein C8R44DRAFT_889412 [Mycena epipterygia]|nr:hypothetical protein C8R44DRAFT_889412 [Mycena epipterygia]